MAEYLQIGVTAMRDPVTGKPLEAVPLYVRKGDAAKAPQLQITGIASELEAKLKQYMKMRKQQGLPL